MSGPVRGAGGGVIPGVVMGADGRRGAALLAGVAAATVLRVGVTQLGASAVAGAVFAVALLLLALASGWRPEAVRWPSLVAGAVGAAVLLAPPALLRLQGAPGLVAPARGTLPLWAAVVVVVAVAEEMALRGALMDAVSARWGWSAAVVVAALAFALLHVPLYGWGAVPLDLAVGLWLGGLRMAAGVWAAASAHAVADVAAWWLL